MVEQQPSSRTETLLDWRSAISPPDQEPPPETRVALQLRGVLWAPQQLSPKEHSLLALLAAEVEAVALAAVPVVATATGMLRPLRVLSWEKKFQESLRHPMQPPSVPCGPQESLTGDGSDLPLRSLPRLRMWPTLAPAILPFQRPPVPGNSQRTICC